jgi:uncharacterized protein DUF3592
MPAYGDPRRHGPVVKILYFAGFFLLFCSLGTFGSAGLITYKATKWPETTAQIQRCSLGEYRAGKEGTLYALNCDITYPFSGRSYKSVLQTKVTRSLQERSAIEEWIAEGRRPATVSIRVNPRYPEQFVVLSPLPGKHGDDAGAFTSAAIIIGCISVVLLAAARVLARQGW